MISSLKIETKGISFIGQKIWAEKGDATRRNENSRPVVSDTPQSEKKTGKICGRILIAEDNPVNQKMTLAMLKALDCKGDVAANGFEVLTALNHKQYDLVLMDCQMPEMDGFAAARAIRKQERDGKSGFQHCHIRNFHIPIIALTAHAMAGAREKCLDAGMDDYLSKPFNLKKLCAKLKPWLTSLR
jgi:CheY-like chemotaxis protein